MMTPCGRACPTRYRKVGTAVERHTDRNPGGAQHTLHSLIHQKTAL